MIWIIIERVTTLPGYERGHVETLEPGQTNWAPVFRSRRLASGAKVRICCNSAASFNFVSGASFIVVARNKPHVLEITSDGIWNPNKEHTFFLRLEKVIHDLKVPFVRNHKFEFIPPYTMLEPRGRLAARG